MKIWGKLCKLENWIILIGLQRISILFEKTVGIESYFLCKGAGLTLEYNKILRVMSSALLHIMFCSSGPNIVALKEKLSKYSIDYKNV